METAISLALSAATAVYQLVENHKNLRKKLKTLPNTVSSIISFCGTSSHNNSQAVQNLAAKLIETEQTIKQIIVKSSKKNVAVKVFTVLTASDYETVKELEIELKELLDIVTAENVKKINDNTKQIASNTDTQVYEIQKHLDKIENENAREFWKKHFSEPCVSISFFRGALKQEVSKIQNWNQQKFSEYFAVLLAQLDANTDSEVDIYEYNEYTQRSTIQDLFFACVDMVEKSPQMLEEPESVSTGLDQQTSAKMSSANANDPSSIVINVQQAFDPHRFRITTDEARSGWSHLFSFVAFSSPPSSNPSEYLKLNVQEAYGPHRFKITTDEPKSGWKATPLSFYVYSNQQPSTTLLSIQDAGPPHRFRITPEAPDLGWTLVSYFYAYPKVMELNVQDAYHPHRYKVSTSEAKSGWKQQFSFYALSLPLPGTFKIYVSEAPNPHRFRLSLAPDPEWEVVQVFYAFREQKTDTVPVFVNFAENPLRNKVTLDPKANGGWTRSFHFFAWDKGPKQPLDFTGNTSC